ncbi:MAG: pyridoxal phosphate-dependent aminotransferase [Candidatus Omnitrophica bacterium]|nr:pyridoxal phosphate-dependent aminotransferase [Candidatus Omnitrophota bacterium]
MKLAKRVTSINPSPTLAITAKANRMRAEGINIIGFGAGEPDFDTPVNIKEAARQAIDKGFTKYTPTTGTKEIKEAVCKKLKNDNGLDYSPSDIIVSCGAKHSIFNILMALCDDNDEVLIPSPYWVSYPEMVKMAGGKPVILKTTAENNFKVSPEQLKSALNPRTKIFILNSPSNPTGMIYTKEELLAIAKILLENKIWCISDEIYEKIVYDDCRHYSIASLEPGMKPLTITVNGVSKAYSMTGWRIGYMAGPQQLIQAMSNLQDHSTSNPASISQKAALEALEGPQEDLKKMLKSFTERRDYIVEKLNSIPLVSCLKPQGAFYVFPNISEVLKKEFNGKKIGDSLAFTDILLTEAKVAVVPGAVFGDDNFIRLSYATSMENIVEGLNRIEQFIKKL